MKQKTITLVIHNSRANVRILAIEPWGDTYELQPGDEIQLTATGPLSSTTLEIVDSSDGLAVYAWIGAVIQLSKNGEELREA